MPLRETWEKCGTARFRKRMSSHRNSGTNHMERDLFRHTCIPEIFREVLKAGGLKHSGMDILANAGMKFNVEKIHTISFHNHPYLEYLTKAGLTILGADIVNGHWVEINRNGRNLREVLMLDGNHLNRLKTINGGAAILGWLRYEQDNDIRITRESLEWIAGKNLKYQWSARISLMNLKA